MLEADITRLLTIALLSKQSISISLVNPKCVCVHLSLQSSTLDALRLVIERSRQTGGESGQTRARDSPHVARWFRSRRLCRLGFQAWIRKAGGAADAEDLRQCQR